jgi:type IV pilus assembly protein PilQ
VREIKDTVILSSGTTMAIGGLYQDEDTVVEKGVPVLSEIPILGFLFKSYRSLKTKKELRFLVRPKIVQPFDRFFVPSED